MQLWPHIMTAVATFSFVCNIFQTISFSREVIACIKNVVDLDSASQLSRLKRTATVMQNLSKCVKHFEKAGTPRNATLKSLAKDCVSTAKELLSNVKDLSYEPAKNNWEVALLYLKRLRKKPEIQALDATLTGFTARVQLALTLDEW